MDSSVAASSLLQPVSSSNTAKIQVANFIISIMVARWMFYGAIGLMGKQVNVNWAMGEGDYGPGDRNIIGLSLRRTLVRKELYSATKPPRHKEENSYFNFFIYLCVALLHG